MQALHANVGERNDQHETQNCCALRRLGGRFRRYKIVDPSFHNWFALTLALRGEGISDFPLCNKSFNLSYCGHDL